MHPEMRRISDKPVAAAGGLILALSLLSTHSAADETGELVIRAATATVTVAPGSAGRRSFRLPTLDFALDVAYQCEPDHRPTSMSLTVSDTRRTLGETELAQDSGRAQVDMVIPADQLPPLVLSDFCTADGTLAGTRLEERLVEGIATVAASLRCDAETGPRASYTSTTLDVTLVCEVPTAEETAE